MILLAFICALIVTTICLTLITSNHYQDGLVGRIGLSLIALGMGLGIVLRDAIVFVDGRGEFYEPSKSEVVFITGMAIFMLRHLIRYWLFCARCEYLAPEDRALLNFFTKFLRNNDKVNGS